MSRSPASEQKVLFLVPTLEAGGAERVCLHHVNHLQIVRPMLVLQFKQGTLLQEIKPEITVLELNTSAPEQLYHRWPEGLRLFFHGYMLFRQARQLSIFAEQHRCSAIVSSITMANIIAVLVKVFFRRRLKVFINVHDITSHILEYTRLKEVERMLLRWFIRQFYPQADLLIAVAQGIKRDLIENFGVPAAKIIVMYNPIDIQAVHQRATESVDQPWFDNKTGSLIVSVGRLVKLKGFDSLIRAVAQLSTHVRLAIIGEGEERENLERLIVNSHLVDRVVLLGFQENPWKYMARADLFVLSSLTEGMPNVIGEAMALGLPILATDCSPGVREYLDNGRAGLLVPPGDSSALAQGIARLLSDERLRQELAQRGRERIAQFDLPTAVRAYEDLLKRHL